MEVKSVETFPVILLNLATPPLPTQTKLNLEQNGWNWVLFLATTLLGEVGGTTGWTQGRTQNCPKGAESYGIIACKGFFTQSQVLLSSIIVGLKNHLISILGARHFLKPHSISNALFK